MSSDLQQKIIDLFNAIPGKKIKIINNKIKMEDENQVAPEATEEAKVEEKAETETPAE